MADAQDPLPVLIVDDDEDAHFFLRRELKQAGLSAAEGVFGGSEAIGFLDACLHGTRPLPALVFLDVMMPGTDGFHVLDWIKAKGLLSRVTVAMVTSSDNPADIARSYARGAHVYLTKPAKADQLRPVIALATKLPPGSGQTRHPRTN